MEPCWSSGTSSVSSSIKRTGSYAGSLGSNNSSSFSLASTLGSDTWYTRIWLYCTGLGTNGGTVWLIVPGMMLRTAIGNPALMDILDPNANGGAQVSTSSIFLTDAWFLLELESKVGAGTGVLGVKVNGVEVYRATNLTVTNAAPVLQLACPDGATIWYFDDIAVNDSSGSANNTAPSPYGQVIHLLPDGDGDADTGSPTRGGTDSGAIWSQLDEVTPNDTTDYVVLPVNPSDCVVSIENASSKGIGPTDTILFVEVHGRICGASGSAANWFPQIQSQASGTRVSATAVTLASALFRTNDDTDGSRQCKLRQLTDPQAGGAWTRALLDSTQIAARTTDGNPDTWVSTLWALVEFIPAFINVPMTVVTQQALSRAANI